MKVVDVRELLDAPWERSVGYEELGNSRLQRNRDTDRWSYALVRDDGVPLLTVTGLTQEAGEVLGAYTVLLTAILAAVSADEPLQVWFDIEQAAEILGVHINTLRRLCRDDEFPAKRVGSQWKIHRSDLGL